MSQKMMLIAVMMLGVFVFRVSAQNSTVDSSTEMRVTAESTNDGTSGVADKHDSSPIQIGFWFDVPGYTQRNKVHGFRLGFPFSGTSLVSGLDLSLFGSHLVGLDGAQISIGYCGTATQSYGFQAAFGVCLNQEHFDGVQASLINKGVVSKGWQVGGGNFSDDIDGAQIGLTNIVTKLRGLQAGIVNIVSRGIGPQIGLVNYADQGSFQLGLVNINLESAMPFMILFNYSK